MFYDHFTPNQICGIFTSWHFVAMAIFFVLLILALWFSRKLSDRQTKIIMWTIAILVTVMEIVKIIIRLYKGEGGDSWIPLYFCSLFIYAIWFSLFKNRHLRNTGFCFMVFGGIVAGICNTIYPSTSLMLFPIWHPASLHSLFYHWLMIYAGCMVLIKKMYQPKITHFFYYFIFVTIATVLAVIVNHFLGTNLMFMGNPFGLGFLQEIFNYSPVLYAFLVFLAQGVALFFATYGVYALVRFIIKRNCEQR